MISKALLMYILSWKSEEPASFSGQRLIPRPFPLPVLDHLQNANIERECPGDLVMCEVRVDAQRLVPHLCVDPYQAS